MEVRILQFSTANGEREYITITEDFESPAEDFQKQGFTLDADFAINGPSDLLSLPLDRTLSLWILK